MDRHVLLIEDEPNIVEAIRFILNRDGWRVSTHTEGEGALEAIRAARPDAVVLDVMLPGRSGLEILADLRAEADSGLADMPVLLLTARGQGRERAVAEEAGATLFMTKPFSNSEVLASVRSLVGL